MISVVLPAFNEAEGVSATVDEVRGVLEGAGYNGFEVIVVDDGSTDGTADIAEGVGAIVIRNLQNLGYGLSLKRGIEAAKNDIIAIADADSTYPVDKIPEMVEIYQSGIHMVIGQRTCIYKSERLIKAPLRLALTWLVEFTTGRKIPDPNSGLRVFSRSDIIPFSDQLSDKYSFTTSLTLAYMLMKKYVVYIPVEYNQRLGHTTVSVLRDTLQTFQYIVQTILYFNPIKIFLAVAVPISVVSVAGLVLSAIYSFDTGLWMGFGGIFLAVIVFALGFLAEQLRQILHEQKQNHTNR